ncbi:MAG: sterol desaturase family protein [Acidobacteriota bacterium]
MFKPAGMPPEALPLVISIVGLVVLLILERAIPASLAGRDSVGGHAAKNLGLGLVNGLTMALVATPLLVGVSLWIEQTQFGLIRGLESPWRTLVGLLLFDAWMYLWHRANHALGLLWRFHRFHHQDEAMDVTTTVRFHPAEIMLSTLARLVVMPLLGLTISELVIYEMVLFPVILLHHSNIRFPERLDRALRVLIVTPAVHRIHHSVDRIETDSNYGSILAVWDRLGRTFRLREDQRPVVFGLAGENHPAAGKATQRWATRG